MERKEPILIFGYIRRKHRYRDIERRNRRKKQAAAPAPSLDENEIPVMPNLAKNILKLKTLLSNSSDVKVHPFRLGTVGKCEGALVFIDGMISKPTLTQSLLRPITNWKPKERLLPGPKLMDTLAQEVLCASEVKVSNSLSDISVECLSGGTILFLEGCELALVVSTKGWEKRSITEPQSETVIRGAREGFNENIRTNTTLIRRKIRNGKLHVEHLNLGRKTRTDIALMYLEGVANPKIVKTIKSRLNCLDVDAILETGFIEEYIEDAPMSPFATLGYSEKPDVIASKILEGRVAILVDGTPFVLTAPMLFVESFQTSEDYNMRVLYASLIRLLRFIGYFLTIFAPAIYIALTAFHQELLPTTLLFSIATSREGTPFPVFIEASIMVFAFEILREAGVRLPRPVGQAISIVGALIMGDAAVSAGIVGAPMVITVAVTAVTGFLVPMQTESAAILRVVMMILAATLGIYGVTLGLAAVLIHLASLTSFGVPYFDALSSVQDAKDTLIRMPLWAMVRRPRYVSKGDSTRIRFFIPPMRPHASVEDEDTQDEAPES